jgi:hypothetical protein
MSDHPNGQVRFELPLPERMVREIDSWTNHRHLAKLRDSLYAHSDEHTFLNACAEAWVAQHLLHRGCDLRFEVPTPSGKQADFEVRRDGQVFYLHVKRLETDQPAMRSMTVSSRLRILERIARPYIVSIRWDEQADDTQMQQLVTEAGQFLQHASVGDELVVRDARHNIEIGAVRIVAPWEGTHVSLTIGLAGFIDESQRIRKLLRRAYKQFMPREDNVILMCSSNAEDQDDFENALLGSHIERWDTFPQRGRRVAHGRAEDGFWHGGSNEQSRFACWSQFTLTEPTLQPHLWLRDAPADHPISELVCSLLGDAATQYVQRV